MAALVKTWPVLPPRAAGPAAGAAASGARLCWAAGPPCGGGSAARPAPAPPRPAGRTRRAPGQTRPRSGAERGRRPREMMAPPPAPAVSGPLAVLDPTGQFAKRKKTSLWFTVALLVVSVFILTIGLAATTRTENVTVGGYYPGIVLVASIVFISFGVVAAFCCAIVDGVFAARHIEPRPLYNKRCQFYSSGIGFLYDAYQTEVTCHTLNSKCQLKIKSNTCYCCDLYNCENSDQSSSYYEFLGVSSCQDVVHLYRLLWSSTVLNIIGLFLGIITAAILGAFKDMVPLSQITFSAAPPPQILYNPAQQILTYAGFCPSAATISTYPSYPLPLQPASNFPGTSSTDISLSEETQPPSQSSSSYGLPPNAPALYTPTYCLPGEKPPPYAP
uniref:Transmembrane protein 255B n=2 Tax=Corvus moneduloides TaxID=1196302 RepID=A0A8C3DTB2_CORMO